MATFSASLALCAVIHRSPVNSPQRLVTRSLNLFFDLRLNYGWVNNREAGDWRYHRAHYDVMLMELLIDRVSLHNGKEEDEWVPSPNDGWMCVQSNTSQQDECLLYAESIKIYSPVMILTRVQNCGISPMWWVLDGAFDWSSVIAQW